ncbi:hypothetical protein BVG79_00886 [Ketogulonicigenium robustum]|uniref:Uncharacterized protein n=1 Tax=Ketogulonicigenium robustum TaxID=92947 RepID=A0A1W6NYB6_9RHOB|nr:hypothetical protein BVG79_00886 [Ketogulonicigenium robustum]
MTQAFQTQKKFAFIVRGKIAFRRWDKILPFDHIIELIC